MNEKYSRKKGLIWQLNLNFDNFCQMNFVSGENQFSPDVFSQIQICTT